MGNYSVLVVFFLCFLRTFTVHGGSLTCRVGWILHYRNCFKAFDERRDYNGAKSFCDSVGASLVQVWDITTLNFLVRITEDANQNVWLGGQYDGQSGQYKWDDGNRVIFANWGRGFPKNGSNSCIVLRPKKPIPYGQLKGVWEDFCCDKESYVVCRKPAFYETRWPENW